MEFQAWALGCLEIPTVECKTQCLLTDWCTGVVTSTGGTCCGISNINLDECDSGDGEWDTHVLTRRVQMATGQCWLHSAVDIAQCETHSEVYDTYVRDPTPTAAWWLTSNFVERVLMPRRYKCNQNSNSICTLQELKALLPSLQNEGYSVVNVRARPIVHGLCSLGPANTLPDPAGL